MLLGVNSHGFLSLCQVIGFSRGWKLQSPKISLFIKWTSGCSFKTVFFFLIFGEGGMFKLGKKHQHGQVSPGTSFHFQVIIPAIRNM